MRSARLSFFVAVKWIENLNQVSATKNTETWRRIIQTMIVWRARWRLKLSFWIFPGHIMLSCAFLLCACGRPIWQCELFRPLFMLSGRRETWWHQRCWLTLSFWIFPENIMLSCAFSLCACGRPIWQCQLLRPLFMLSGRRETWWHQRCWLTLSFWIVPGNIMLSCA